MDYLKLLQSDQALAERFDSLFDFFVLDDLSPRDEVDGRVTFTQPGMTFPDFVSLKTAMACATG